MMTALSDAVTQLADVKLTSKESIDSLKTKFRILTTSEQKETEMCLDSLTALQLAKFYVRFALFFPYSKPNEFKSVSAFSKLKSKVSELSEDLKTNESEINEIVRYLKVARDLILEEKLPDDISEDSQGDVLNNVFNIFTVVDTAKASAQDQKVHEEKVSLERAEQRRQRKKAIEDITNQIRDALLKAMYEGDKKTKYEHALTVANNFILEIRPGAEFLEQKKWFSEDELKDLNKDVKISIKGILASLLSDDRRELEDISSEEDLINFYQRLPDNIAASWRLYSAQIQVDEEKKSQRRARGMSIADFAELKPFIKQVEEDLET